MRFSFPVFQLAVFLALLSPNHPAKAQGIFDRWDGNDDGRLAPAEVPEGPRRNFKRADTDGDGFISRAEDAAFRERMRRPERPSHRDRPSPSRPGPSRPGPSRPGPSITESLEIHRDIDYAGDDNPRQKLDLFLPKKRAEDDASLPLVAFIHGGGWRAGDKNGGLRRLQGLLSSGRYAGASIGYRLSDEAQWPAQIHDCKAAIRWLRANAREHGIDPERITVWGTSAGGHLVAMLGVSNNVPELEGTLGPHPDVSSAVAGVVNFFGPSDLLAMNRQGSSMDHDSANSPESRLVGGPIQDHPDEAKSASPVTWVSDDDVPMLLVHGTEDPLVPHQQSIDLERMLEEKRVPAVLLSVEGGGHGKGFGPSVDEAVTTWLDNLLHGVDAKVSDGQIAAGE